MELGDRLGITGIILFFIGLGVTIMWPTKRWIAYVSFVIAVILGACWGVAEFKFHHHSQEHEMASVQDSKPPTLLDLFKSDFGSTMKLADTDGVAYRVQAPDGSTVDVGRQVYMDFPAQTKFIGFYIHRPNPPSQDFNANKTVAACFDILRDNLVQDTFNTFQKNVGVMSGQEGQKTTVQDLVFSRRVLIYHEEFLSIPQKADILNAYKVKHLDVQFMGDDYLGAQVIAWHQKHDLSPKPQ